MVCQIFDRECLSLLSAFERDFLTLSRIVRGPVVCFAHECSQQERWLLDLSRYGQCCLRSLENKLSCCGVARANTTPVQLRNVTYDQTNDISKGNLETIDLDGALWIAVACVGVRPVSVRCAASVTHSNPCLWCLETRKRKPTSSAMGTVSRMRWPRPSAGWYCAQSGIRGVVNLLGKVRDKQSVDKLECWVWDQVYTMNAIPVLSLAMCMLSFHSTGKDVTKTAGLVRWSQICWQRLGWRGFVWLRVMLIHRGGHAGFFECCLQGGCKEYLIPRVLWCLASGRRAVRGSQ